MADLNRLAHRLVQESTAEVPKAESESQQVQAGRQGGRKGGNARASALTPERRAEIARKAAKARWSQS